MVLYKHPATHAGDSIVQQIVTTFRYEFTFKRLEDRHLYGNDENMIKQM